MAPPSLPAGLHLGTSSWSCKDWVGHLYPEGTPPREFITAYAEHFSCVEVDSTFYRIPARSTVQGWAARTPDGFRFAAKVPRDITHDAELEDCGDTFEAFLEVMAELGPKQGPLLLQFPYYAKAKRPPLGEFLGRLDAFLAAKPAEVRMAVEIRNKTWLRPEFFDGLRRHGAAYAVIAHPWMPPPGRYGAAADLVTADFAYVRWLGDRYGIEKQTKTWNATVVDRTKDLDAWVPLVEALVNAKTVGEVWGFFNNHYAGYAPDSIRLFVDRWLARPPAR